MLSARAGGRTRGLRPSLVSPRLPGLPPSPFGRGRGRGSAGFETDPSGSAREGVRGRARGLRPPALRATPLRARRGGDGPRAVPRPSPRWGGVWGTTGLGTTLGRACSRGCRERKVRSKIGWLAGSRDSHHVSRFAAFFILARAEISVDGSCFGVSFLAATLDAGLNRHPREGVASFSLRLSVARSISREGEEGARSGVNRDGPPSFFLRRREREAPTLRIGVARGLPKPRKRGLHLPSGGSPRRSMVRSNWFVLCQ